MSIQSYRRGQNLQWRCVLDRRVSHHPSIFSLIRCWLLKGCCRGSMQLGCQDYLCGVLRLQKLAEERAGAQERTFWPLERVIWTENWYGSSDLRATEPVALKYLQRSHVCHFTGPFNLTAGAFEIKKGRRFSKHTRNCGENNEAS